MSNASKAISLVHLAMYGHREHEVEVAKTKLRRLLQRDNSLLSLVQVREFLASETGYAPEPQFTRPVQTTRYHARDVKIEFDTEPPDVIWDDVEDILNRMSAKDFYARGGSFEFTMTGDLDSVYEMFVAEMVQRARTVEYERQMPSSVDDD